MSSAAERWTPRTVPGTIPAPELSEAAPVAASPRWALVLPGPTPAQSETCQSRRSLDWLRVREIGLYDRPMRNIAFLSTFLLATEACLSGQGPQVPIDNDQARVVKVVDQPHSKGQPHEHKLNRVMIYLTPGRQEITPQGGKTAVLEFKAGDVKWSPASGIHVSEITSDQPVAIVEVELKKPGGPAGNVTAALDPVRVDPNDYKVEFENGQVRVVRVKIAAHQKVPLHEHLRNRVVVCLTDQNGTMTTPDGKTEAAQHKAGEVSWGGPTKHQEENLRDGPFEAIVVELKD